MNVTFRGALLALAFVCPITQASGASYTFGNGSGAGASGFETMQGFTFRAGTLSGTPFSSGGGISAGSGVIAFGTFDIEDFGGITDTGEWVNSWDQFGNAFAFNGAGANGDRSIFSSFQSETLGGSSLAGDEIFVMIGTGTSFANSAQIGVLKTTFTFAVDDSNPLPTLISINPTNSTPMYGIMLVSNVKTTDTDSTTTPGWRIFIPEPSTALLGLLGAISLLRRRR